MKKDTFYNVVSISTNDSVFDSYDDIDSLSGLEMLMNSPLKVLAFVIGLLGIVANLMCLASILHVRGPISLHYRLIVSLCVSDIVIDLSVTLTIINSALNPYQYPYNRTNPMDGLFSHCSFVILRAMTNTGLAMSLLNLMAMATDHYLATSHPLQHLHVLRGCRANIIIASLWVFGILSGFSDFVSPLFEKYWLHSYRYNYCAFTSETPYQEEFAVFVIMFVCLFSMVCVYIRVYHAVRRHHSFVYQQTQHIRRRTKALLTTLLVLGTFVVCWLPICIFEIALIFQVLIDKSAVLQLQWVFIEAKDYLYDLLLVNSLMDPLIYAIRLRDVRLGFRVLLLKVRCRKPRKKQWFSFQTSRSMIGERSVAIKTYSSYNKTLNLELRRTPSKMESMI